MNKKNILIIVSSIIAVLLISLAGFMVYNNKKAVIYDISFVTDGGTSVSSQKVSEKERVKKPADPTKDGYIFIEWTYKNKAYDFSSKVTSNLVLKAKWTKKKEDIETYVIRFDSDGGTTISNQIIEKGNKVQKPSDPQKEGYNFIGWFLNEEVYNFDTILDRNLDLKAKWEKVEIIRNKTIKKNNNKKVNNTTTNNSSSVTTNNNVSNNNNNTTKPAVKKYTVTFNSNGGSSVSSQTVTEGNKAVQPSNPTRNGYTFAGWTLNGNTYNFNSKVTSNITLVAKWNEVVKEKYTVTFNSNGGSSVSSQTVTEGNKAVQPSNPTRNGYTFAGWTLNGNAYNFNSTVTGNITLAAKWNQKSYTVKVSSVDQYSPDRILTVYEDGKQISVSAIKYNGVTLCNGSNMVVNVYEISGINSVTVVLKDGTSVTASVQQ